MSSSPDLTDLLSALVRIDSQNPDLVPGAVGERAIAEFCVSWMQRHGVEAWIDEVAPGRCNAVGRITRSDGPTVSLCAHLDTVSTAGMDEDGLQPRVAGGRMYGRGTYDMKGGVAAVLSCMAALAKDPPRGTVLAALVCDEEYASIGAADFVRRYRSDACIVTEPSERRLILAHKGFVWAEIETRGVAAHGSKWETGVSAIDGMGRIIAALGEFDRSMLRERTHPLLGPASLHCAMVSGGDGWSTYAPHCSLRVERRTLPGESAADVIAELRSVVAATGIQADVRESLSRSPLECSPDSAIARAVGDAASAAVGTAPDIAGVAYWMDAAIFADGGADTVDFGPAGAGAHGAVEWVDLESVSLCATVITDAVRRFTG